MPSFSIPRSPPGNSSERLRSWGSHSRTRTATRCGICQTISVRCSTGSTGMTGMSEVPVYLEPRVAWRAWELGATDQSEPSEASWSVRPYRPTKSQNPNVGRSGLLSGDGKRWPPYQRFEAHCRIGKDHRCPDPKCTCGIYAARSHRILREMGYAAGPDDEHRPDLIGELSVW